MSTIPKGSRLQVFEVSAGDDPNRAAFFVRKGDAERYGKHVNRDVKEGYVTDGETIDYLCGPRHVPDCLRWFLREGVMAEHELSLEDRAALLRAFGAES